MTKKNQLQRCWRCGLSMTGKRIDGKPVCNTCMVSDAGINRGIVLNYSDLTPIFQKHDTKPPATKPKAPAKRKPKVEETTELTPTTKARLNHIATEGQGYPP